MGFLLPSFLACVPYLYSEEVTGDWVAPENTWPSQTPPAETVEQGFSSGEVPPDFRGTDQHGDEVSLWQFYGMLVVVDISTMWCAPCQELAADVEETYHHYLEDEVMYLTVLPENLQSEPPTIDDLNQWADAFGISAPVLGDAEGWSYNLVPQGSTEGFPNIMLLDRDLSVLDNELEASDAAIRAAIEAAL